MYLNLESIRIGNKGYKLITYRVTCGKDVCALFWVNAKPNFDRPFQNLAQLEWAFDDISPCKILKQHYLCHQTHWLSLIDSIIWIIIKYVIIEHIFFWSILWLLLLIALLSPLKTADILFWLCSKVSFYHDSSTFVHNHWLTYGSYYMTHIPLYAQNYLDLQNVKDSTHVLWEWIVN